MNYNLSENIDKSKVFLINLSQIEGRLDPMTYHPERLNTIKKLKNSGVTLKPLKKLVDFSKSLVHEIEDKNTIYIGLENIESDTGEYIPTNKKETISSAIVFDKGDILFPKLRPYLNKVFYATFSGICSTEFHVFKSSKINNKYLSHYLRSKLVVNQTKYLMSGNTLPRLQTEDIHNLLIPRPDDIIQKNVIYVMELAKNKRDCKKEKGQELLKDIDEFVLKELGIKLPEKDNSLQSRIFSTTFQKLTGNRFDPFYNQEYFQRLDKIIDNCKYSTKPLRDLCYSVRGVTYSGNDEIQDNSGIGIIRANNITLATNSLNFDEVRFIRKDFPILALQKLQKGDILMSAASGSKEHVGKVAYIDQDLPFYFGGFMSVLRCYEKEIIPEYLFFFLRSKIYREILFRVLGGTNINNLNFSMISNFRIPLPPIEKQKEIATEANRRRFEAQRLEKEARETLEQARQEIERIILNP